MCVVRILEKIDHVISSLHCISKFSDRFHQLSSSCYRSMILWLTWRIVCGISTFKSHCVPLAIAALRKTSCCWNCCCAGHSTLTTSHAARGTRLMQSRLCPGRTLLPTLWWVSYVQITMRSCCDPAVFKLRPALQHLAHLLYNILITLLLWPPLFLVVSWWLLLIARCVGCHATRVCCTSSVSRRSSVHVTPVLRSKSRTPSEWTAG